jgi:hypothetical protein
VPVSPTPPPPSSNTPSPGLIAAAFAALVAFVGFLAQGTTVLKNIRQARRETAEDEKKARLTEITEAVRPLLADIEARHVERHEENRSTLGAISERLAVTESRVNDLWERRSSARRDDPDRRGP